MREWIIQAETIGNISEGYWYGDGEEIVRCKDCKHNLYPGKPNTVCGLDIPIFDCNGFCSEGERKSDG